MKMNLCSIWPFAQISDDFYYLCVWQCARYFVTAILKELALITISEMWGLESRSRTSRSRSRLEIWASSRSRGLRSRLHHWSLYCAANKFRGTFDQCPPGVKNTLFRAYWQGRSQTFSFGGATGGASFATRGAVNDVCRTFRKRRPTPVAWRHAENFGRASRGARQNFLGVVALLAPP